jgi:branched-chain amino acid transport system permease protein
MLDEPVAGMNREETEDMARFILDVRAEWGVTVLMVEHDMGMVMDLSDHVVVLNFGQVIAQGTPAVVQADPEVNRAYLGAGDVGDLRRCAAAASAHAAAALAQKPLMDWAYLFEIALTGLASGGLYALAALAFVMVYKATRVVNIAIGELLMVGAYLFFTFAAMLALPLWLAIPAAVLGTGLLGAVIERTMIRPLLGEPPISVFMVTVGLASVLVGLVEMIWSADQRRLPEFMPTQPIMVGDAFSRPRCSGARDRRGVHRRRAAGVPLLARRRGAARHGQRPGSRLLGGHQRAARVLAVLGGVRHDGGHLRNHRRLDRRHLVEHGRVRPVGAGGRHRGRPGQRAGRLVGGLFIGLVEALAGAYLGGEYKLLATFIVLVGILMLRPYGLFGTHEIERL